MIDSAVTAARIYLAQPEIVNLHGVTGAMALDLPAPHLTERAVVTGVTQPRADHRRIHRGQTAEAARDNDGRPVDPPVGADPGSDPVVAAAAESGDPHQVKLVEACVRGFAARPDPVWAAAARAVTGESPVGAG